MKKYNKYLNVEIIKHELNNERPKNLSIILGMIVLVITLSVVTFTQASNNYHSYSYKYKL